MPWVPDWESCAPSSIKGLPNTSQTLEWQAREAALPRAGQVLGCQARQLRHLCYEWLLQGWQNPGVSARGSCALSCTADLTLSSQGLVHQAREVVHHLQLLASPSLAGPALLLPQMASPGSASPWGARPGKMCPSSMTGLPRVSQFMG